MYRFHLFKTGRVPTRAHLGLLLLMLVASGTIDRQAFAQGSEKEALTAREHALVEHIEGNEKDGLDLLRRSVNVNSGTLNFEGVREVGRLFQAEFEALGLRSRWLDGSSFGRAGHLIAEGRGNGPRLLLIGHLDTVFEPDSPFQSFEKLSETEVRGPGVIDMKGGNVVMVQALKALAAAGELAQLNLTIILTGDEERSGRPLDLARAELVEAARWADVALGFEDGDGSPHTAVVSRRGSTSWRLEVTGTPAHSSQIFQPQFGDGAIFEMARILDEFRRQLGGEENLTFNPGLALGGTTVEFDSSAARGSSFGKNNVIAESAVVTGDLRCISPQQYEQVRQRMHEIVSRGLIGTSSNITFDPGYPPMAPTDGNLRLLRLYDQISQDLGLGPVRAVNPREAGAADISFAAGHVEMALDGLGLMGRDGHTVEETADLTTLASQTKRAAVLIHRLSQGLEGTSSRRF